MANRRSRPFKPIPRARGISENLRKPQGQITGRRDSRPYCVSIMTWRRPIAGTKTPDDDGTAGANDGGTAGANDDGIADANDKSNDHREQTVEVERNTKIVNWTSKTSELYRFFLLTAHMFQKTYIDYPFIYCSPSQSFFHFFFSYCFILGRLQTLSGEGELY